MKLPSICASAGIISLLLALMAVVAFFLVSAVPDRGIPILIYHEIGPLGDGDREMFIDPHVFRLHMRHLKEQGYTSITLKELHAHYTKRQPLPRNPVVLTFDDGYQGVYENAWPIMKEFGFVGVLFVTDYLGKPGYMTDSQVAALVSHGFELGSHSRTHANLLTRSDEELIDEVGAYKHELERRFGVPVTSFAYPMGYFDQRVVDAVREGGFLIGVTVQEGLADVGQGLLTLRRVPIFRYNCMRSFIRKLNIGR